MLFNSWTFAIFLFALFAFYYQVGRSRAGLAQIFLLTLASYVFYAWQNPWLVILLLCSTWINAFVSLKLTERDTSPLARKRWVQAGIVCNLGVLAFFKYASLLVLTFLPKGWWTHCGFDLSAIPLPIGISFFTFQGISLVVDVYRAQGKGIPGLEPPDSTRAKWWLLLRMAFFKAFFPQLVAGPIVKAHEFMYQIGPKRFSDIDWEDAIRKLVLGFFFKMVVADNLKEATQAIAYPTFTTLPSAQLLLLLYGFSIQIFADFCGYSLIAMGLARLFGYQLPLNFNFPYISGSITEFWRRWHISLSTWLKQYLYFPLGGNRKGLSRTYLNLMVVMLLGGLWHGAAWSYMVWGGAHGLFLAIERACGCTGASFSEDPAPSRFRYFTAGLRIFLTFNLVSLLWLLFKLPHFGEAVTYLKCIANLKPGLLPQPSFVILFFSLPVVIYHFYELSRERLHASFQTWPSPVQFGTKITAFGLLLFMILANSGTKGDFIYFQF